MKNRLLLFLSLFCANWLLGQSLSPQVIATAGDHFVADSVQVSWTIGEPVIETFYGQDSVILTQGFHQPNLMVTAIEDLALDIQVDVFPNPTAGQVNVQVREFTAPMQITLLDANGRQLAVQNTSPQSLSNQFNLSRYANGVYYLRINTKDQQTIKSFIIIKSN